jgi:hypothetical protein
MGRYMRIFDTRQLLEMAAYQQIIRLPFPEPYQTPPPNHPYPSLTHTTPISSDLYIPKTSMPHQPQKAVVVQWSAHPTWYPKLLSAFT